MANLVLKLESSFDYEKGTITPIDVSGLYNAETNPTGWGIETLDRQQISEATIDLFFVEPDKEPIKVTTKDVTSVVFEATAPHITFTDLFGNVEKDGVYKMRYIVISEAGEEYRSIPIVLFVIEGIDKAVSKHWATLAANPDIHTRKPLETECIWLESYTSGIKSVMRRGDEAQFLNMLSFIQRRIKVNVSNKLVKL